MEAASHIHWMREENFDGKEETAGEESTCEGNGQSQNKTQSNTRSQEGREEICCEESYDENYQEGGPETFCGGSQARAEKAGSKNGVSLVAQARVYSPCQEARAVVHGRGRGPEARILAADGVSDAERCRS